MASARAATAACWSSSAPARASRPRSCSPRCRARAPMCRSTFRETRPDGGQAARWPSAFPASPCGPIVGDFSAAAARSRPTSPDARKTRLLSRLDHRQFRRPRGARVCSRVFAALLAPGGRLIVGVDLKKDARKLVRAYNDAAGVTAAFNLNLLARINRELGGDVRPRRLPARGDLQRRARAASRCTSSAGRDQDVERPRPPVSASGAGETIHTENSYKYSIAQFQELARVGRLAAAAACGPTRTACSACTSSSPVRRSDQSQALRASGLRPRTRPVRRGRFVRRPPGWRAGSVTARAHASPPSPFVCPAACPLEPMPGHRTWGRG